MNEKKDFWLSIIGLIIILVGAIVLILILNYSPQCNESSRNPHNYYRYETSVFSSEK